MKEWKPLLKAARSKTWESFKLDVLSSPRWYLRPFVTKRWTVKDLEQFYRQWGRSC